MQPPQRVGQPAVNRHDQPNAGLDFSRRRVSQTAALPRLADISTVDQAAKAMRDEEMLAEIEDFLEGFNRPTYRGMWINGRRLATWSSDQGWSGL